MDLNPQPFSTRLKVATLVIVILLFLLVAPAKWFGVGKQTYAKNDLSQAQADLVIQNINEDLDGDGIPNWKESLLGTSPSTKNKVPVLGGEDSLTSAEDRRALTRLEDPKNLTSQFIKNTVGLSTYLNDQGVTDEQTLTQVSNNIVTEAEKLNEVRVFTRSNLTKISSDEKLASVRVYGNALALILMELYGRLDLENILNPLQEYTRTQDVKKLSEYQIISTFLNTIINRLTIMSVPSSAVPSHLYLINAIEGYRMVLLGIGNAGEDPMKGLIAVNSYKNSYADFINSVYILGGYFSDKGVVFSSKENGSLFTQVILNK